MDNHQIWNQPDVASRYRGHQGLSLAEKAVFDRLDLAETSLLDIGIGAGRTTQVLMERVSRYVGVDYADSMVAATRTSLGSDVARGEFMVCDVRNLSPFAANEFDVVFFSYNGIDYLPFEERSAAIDEMLRVLRPGGTLVFSTHHLSRGLDQFNLGKRLSRPGGGPREAVRWMLHRFLRNPGFDLGTARRSGHAIINDKDGDDRFTTCYVDPIEQRDGLSDRFEAVSVFSSVSGELLTQDDAIRESPDLWLYFLCEGKA